METKNHDEDGTHRCEENFFPETMKCWLVVVARNVATKEHGASHDKCKKDENLFDSVSVSLALCHLIVVRKFNRDEESEVECKDDIDECVAPLCHSIEEEYTKDRE